MAAGILFEDPSQLFNRTAAHLNASVDQAKVDQQVCDALDLINTTLRYARVSMRVDAVPNEANQYAFSFKRWSITTPYASAHFSLKENKAVVTPEGAQKEETMTIAAFYEQLIKNLSLHMGKENTERFVQTFHALVEVGRQPNRTALEYKPTQP